MSLRIGGPSIGGVSISLIAAAIILATGFDRADPIASLVVVCLMLRSAYGLLRDSGRVLLEAAPEGIDVDEIAAAIASDPRVVDVHDLHMWEIGRCRSTTSRSRGHGFRVADCSPAAASVAITCARVR
jgi:Co/Zn/Cd efflux system component